MRKSTRNELNKARELVHFLLLDKVCVFCQGPLVDSKFVRHGNSFGPKLIARITIHHHDEDHENNEQRNKDVAHEACHRRWNRIRKQQQKLREQLLSRPAGSQTAA